MTNLQEKINMLEHHEANDQCTGGALCLLQSPMWLNPPSIPDQLAQVFNFNFKMILVVKNIL
jgi:hypothetical protein